MILYTNRLNYYIEETSCQLNSSVNNAQLRRSSKFIPKINTNDIFII